MQFVYPYTVYQGFDGAWQVRFPDVASALTEGDTEEEAHALAKDALLAALGGLIKLRGDIPVPSQPTERMVIVPLLQAAKLALYQAMRAQRLNTVSLGERLGRQEGEIRRMLDLDHATKIETLESALRLLGRQITCEVHSTRPDLVESD